MNPFILSFLSEPKMEDPLVSPNSRAVDSLSKYIGINIYGEQEELIQNVLSGYGGNITDDQLIDLLNLLLNQDIFMEGMYENSERVIGDNENYITDNLKITVPAERSLNRLNEILYNAGTDIRVVPISDGFQIIKMYGY